jgi:hypothetical protein
MTQDEIKDRLNAIRMVLDLDVLSSEPASLVSKLEQISGVLGMSAEVMAATEAQHNIKLYAVYEQSGQKSATEKKIIFGEKGKLETYYQSLSEKYNKELHYQIDLLRTLISYAKKDFDTLGK